MNQYRANTIRARWGHGQLYVQGYATARTPPLEHWIEDPSAVMARLPAPPGRPGPFPRLTVRAPILVAGEHTAAVRARGSTAPRGRLLHPAELPTGRRLPRSGGRDRPRGRARPRPARPARRPDPAGRAGRESLCRAAPRSASRDLPHGNRRNSTAEPSASPSASRRRCWRRMGRVHRVALAEVEAWSGLRRGRRRIPPRSGGGALRRAGQDLLPPRGGLAGCAVRLHPRIILLVVFLGIFNVISWRSCERTRRSARCARTETAGSRSPLDTSWKR